TRASGNILFVDNKGNVYSILKMIESERQKPKIMDSKVKLIKKYRKRPSDGKIDRKHIIHTEEDKNNNFKPIVYEKEPWILHDYNRNSYCLFHDDERTLQLFIGRSTVQIWHKIHSVLNDKINKEEQLLDMNKTKLSIKEHGDENKKEISKTANDSLPNKGEPFLEYIWTNGIPVNQERNETGLRIEDFKYTSEEKSEEKSKESKDESKKLMKDFYLKV